MNVKVTIKLSRWFTAIYLPMLLSICRVLKVLGFDIEPDIDKVGFWMRKALRIKPAK